VGLLVVALFVTAAAHSHMDTVSRVEEGEWIVPSPEHARFFSLGFDSLLADYYWLMAVQRVGAEHGDTTQHAPLIGRLIGNVTALDPWVDHPYRFASFWLTDSLQSVGVANRLLEQGIAYNPLDWRNAYYLGFNYFFYLEDNARAAEYLDRAARLPGSPVYLGALVARLRNDLGGIDVAASFLRDLVRNSEDGYQRAANLKALDEIDTERAARFLDAARTRYWGRHGRDIERVEDLLAGPDPVIRALPPAHPQFAAEEWLIDPESARIVSSFYGNRYELHIHPVDRARMDQWRARRASEEVEESI